MRIFRLVVITTNKVLPANRRQPCRETRGITVRCRQMCTMVSQAFSIVASPIRMWRRCKSARKKSQLHLYLLRRPVLVDGTVWRSGVNHRLPITVNRVLVKMRAPILMWTLDKSYRKRDKTSWPSSGLSKRRSDRVS